MTPPILEYFANKKNVARKKEPQYLAFINKNSCTSCGSCATMCPVDCIFEVEGNPSESHHQIDTSRCIGCQMCYRVPNESTGPWQMEICPWNAIDMLYNPNFTDKGAGNYQMVWEPYYVGGSEPAPNFRKLEEFGYQLFLNRTVYLKRGGEYEKLIEPFTKPVWSYGEGEFTIAKKIDSAGDTDLYATTEAGNIMVDFLYKDYDHVFLD